jgi:hypothetical protein
MFPSRIVLTAGWLLALWPVAATARPLQALFGKSMVAAWTEDRDVK